ncbi:MAG: integrase, partial [Gammaproteobacteria bacterium]|nr:integrase [Gammaproteobacteria bacterium]
MLKLRGKHPYMGKARLRAMLARDGLALSVSTVGRILSKAIADGRIKPASFCEGRIKPKRRRNFDGAWANRWRHGDRARAPGEMVQVDHMTFSKDGRTLKEFRAVCPVSKFMASRVFSQATAG